MVAVDTPTYTYDAEILRWVDGDTVDLRVILEDVTQDYGFRFFEQRKKWVEDRFRLARVDTPERGQPNHAEATAFSIAAAPHAAKVKVQTFQSLQDKYGRYLGLVEPLPVVLQADGTPLSVNQMLVDKGLAKPYFGGTKA